MIRVHFGTEECKTGNVFSIYFMTGQAADGNTKLAVCELPVCSSATVSVSHVVPVRINHAPAAVDKTSSSYTNTKVELVDF